MNITDYFINGLKNTIKLKSGKNFSFFNSWQQIYPNTVIDEFYLADFVAAEYTIIVDAGSSAREILKCIVVAGLNIANVSIYGRVNLGTNLINLNAVVNSSKVSLIASPAVGAGHKCYITANYYQSITKLEDL